MSDNTDHHSVSTLGTSQPIMSNDDAMMKKLLEDKPKKIDMGPRWSEEELEIFLTYFRQSGLKDMQVMQSALNDGGYNRSSTNLFSVYWKNRNFLTMNTHCTAKDLNAIMADHYESIEADYPAYEKLPLKQIESESDNMAEKRKISPFNPKYIHSTDASKSRGGYEDSLTLKRKASKSKKPGNNYPPNSDENYETFFHKAKKMNMGYDYYPAKEKTRKSRKSQNQTNKIVTGMFQLDEEGLFRKIEYLSRSCTGKMNRKPSFPLNKKPTVDDSPLSPALMRYIQCELFYSSVEKPYFFFNEFRFLLGDQNTTKKYKRAEWYVIRSCLGKPRRFSNAFIKSQLDDLHQYRTIVRSYLFHRINLSETKLHPVLIQKIKELKPMLVSQIVLAFHPGCNHVHSGSVLTTTGPNAIVKFYPNELGAIPVVDTKIIILNPEEASYYSETLYGNRMKVAGLTMSRTASEQDSEGKGGNQQKILQDIDYNAMAFFIKILERKTTLVNELRNFNDLAEANPAALNEKFYQEYGWTGVQINLLDNALKHIAAKFRLRGLHNFNLNQVMQNFDKLLANPLKNFLEMEPKKGDQDIDPKYFKELKSLLSKNTEQRVDEQLKLITAKFETTNEIGLPGPVGDLTAPPLPTTSNKSEGSPKLSNANAAAGSATDLNGNINFMEIESPLLPPQQPQSATLPLAKKPIESASLEEQNKWLKLVKDDMDEGRRTALRKMSENIVGVLLSLKQNGELNITENRYLTDLCNSIYEENPEEFHEINNILLNISSK
jgi:hypothetical protein